jgi:putative ABC transport system permease protein
LSHGLWQRRFGGEAALLGRTVQIDGDPFEVIGVMPQGFRLPTDYGEDAAEPTQLWLPLQLDPATTERGNHGLYGAARLAAGATPRSANEELRALTSRLTEAGEYPREMGFTALAVPVEEEVLGRFRPVILLLTGAVAVLLLIACANVANLLLARAEGRQREIALRAALGAGRARLLRQLLAEGLLLALLAGGVGLALAQGGVRLLEGFGSLPLPRSESIAVDGRVLAFTLALSLATTLLFALAPALRVLRVDLVDALKEGGAQAGSGRARSRFRAALVVSETALAVVLVIGAGLLLRSLWALQRIDLGFRPEGVLTLRLSLPEAGYAQPEQVIVFYDRLLDEVRGLPGVRQAGLVRSLPLANSIGDWGLDVDGFVESPGNTAQGDWQVASDGAPEALGERIVRGRAFAAADTADAQPVALVNESLARLYWPERDALGGRIRMGSAAERPWLTVVGIVADEKHNGVTAPVKGKFYVPHSQFHLSIGRPVRDMALVLRADVDPLALAAPVRAIVQRMDPNVPVANVRRMTQVVADSLVAPRLAGFLLALFAALALALAAIGIYGVLSYLVSRRTREIGVRLAVGADAGRVRAMVLRDGLSLAGRGVVAGLLLALLASRVLSSLLHEVAAVDPMTFSVVPCALLLVSLLASYLPARRATRVNPLAALRVD